MTLSKEKILEVLSGVREDKGADPRDIVARGMVSSLQVMKGNEVVFALEVDPAMGAALEPLRQRAENAVRALPGVKSASAVLTAQRPASAQASAASTSAHGPRGGADPHGMAKNPPLSLPFRHVIAVASGKGGVGKSTVAFNLAVALARRGLAVALLDADIYGPSVPRLSGLGARKPATNDQGKLVPLEAYGVKLMSIGFLVEEDKALIWRGPMVQTAFYQMLRDVDWCAGGWDEVAGKDGDEAAPAGQGEAAAASSSAAPARKEAGRQSGGDAQRPSGHASDHVLEHPLEGDILVIDMPPGTGDVQLTLAQKVPVSGAVIVSTPQDLALIDARKAIAMFDKTGVPILGVVENMAHYCCPNCGHRDYIFGQEGARAEAKKHNVSFLGEVPLHPQIRQQADAGEASNHESYEAIAQALDRSLLRT